MIYLDDNIADFNLEAALPLLSEQRREQLLKFKHELGRKTCAMAYLLLRQGLQQEYNITEPPIFAYNEHGKPHIVGHDDIHFNMSHCRAGVVCALSDAPIGVDIESIREYNDSLARYTMNEEELQTINAAERPEVAFTRFWTMKEAVMKCKGSGIVNNLKDVLTGVTGILTTVNERRGYVFSVCSSVQLSALFHSTN